MNKHISRRDLLKQTAAMAVGSAFFLGRPIDAWASGKSATSRVVLIRNQQLYAGGSEEPDPAICGQMLDRALCTLTGEANADKAWQTIIKPSDIVGIKTNAWNKLPTPAVLNDLLKERVLGAGVKADCVSVNDRTVKTDPVFQKSTALINIRPMRTHAWSGVGTLLKNYIMFAEKPSAWHDDSCAGLGGLYSLPMVKDKTRLFVLVMFTPQFHHLTPMQVSKEFLWNYNGLLVGFDPVAVDSTGLRIIEAKRNEYFGEYKPLNPPAKHIAAADTQFHLGTADPAKIELVKLGWDDKSYV